MNYDDKKTLILAEIQSYVDEQQVPDAKRLFAKSVADGESENAPYLPELLFEYGCFLFNLEEYEEALEKLVKAYDAGYERATVKEVIEYAYITPNLEILSANYKANRAKIAASTPEFENIPYLAVPASDEVFYLFDWAREKIAKVENREALIDEQTDIIAAEREYYYYALERGHDKSLYFLCPERDEFYACLAMAESGAEEIVLFSSLNEMRSYFSDTDISLPQNLWGDKDTCDVLMGILHAERERRMNMKEDFQKAEL
ncbi:MAG: hypothetical protein LBR98_03735 [Syntrophomonadaceae bacterium]|nr:hypothetical protein [Syntrophomonadaceae bacterium]